jgi:hypothetical protein
MFYALRKICTSFLANIFYLPEFEFLKRKLPNFYTLGQVGSQKLGRMLYFFKKTSISFSANFRLPEF